MSNEPREPVSDNRKYLRQSMLMWDLPPIDIADPKAVWERGLWYINHYCRENNLRPGVEGLCFAWGISRRTFSGWASGAHRSQTHTQIAQRFKMYLESLLVSDMMDGRISHAVGIFFLKAHHGYTDRFDLELSQGQPGPDASLSPEELAEKYAPPMAVE